MILMDHSIQISTDGYVDMVKENSYVVNLVREKQLCVISIEWLKELKKVLKVDLEEKK
jgi:hypothetical protein